MVSRIVQANQVAADVMRTGTNVLQGGWTLKQGGALHRDAMRKKRAREDSREFEPTGRCFDPRCARFYVGFTTVPTPLDALAICTPDSEGPLTDIPIFPSRVPMLIAHPRTQASKRQGQDGH